MARPKISDTKNILSALSWLDSKRYRDEVENISDLDLVRSLFDRYHLYRQAAPNNKEFPQFEYFQEIVGGKVFPDAPMHGYFFDRAACNDFGYLGQAKEVSESKFIEPLSANHILHLNEMLPYDEDPTEHLTKNRGFFAYTYQAAFENMFCLNINCGATDAQIISELKELLPKLRSRYNKQPLVKQLTPKIQKIRDQNILALCDLLIYWKYHDLGQLLAPIICSVVYSDQRTAEEIKDLELKSALEILNGDSSDLILMGRFFQ